MVFQFCLLSLLSLSGSFFRGNIYECLVSFGVEGKADWGNYIFLRGNIYEYLVSFGVEGKAKWGNLVRELWRCSLR